MSDKSNLNVSDYNSAVAARSGMAFKGCIFENRFYPSIYIEADRNRGGWFAPLGKDGEMIKIVLKQFTSEDGQEFVLFIRRFLEFMDTEA